MLLVVHMLFYSCYSAADRVCYNFTRHCVQKKIAMYVSFIFVCAGSYLDCVATAVISGVLFFIVGLVGGLAGGVLVVYCCVKWQSKHHPPPSQPAPPYEDIVVTSTVKGEVELQLRDNVAYGQVV